MGLQSVGSGRWPRRRSRVSDSCFRPRPSVEFARFRRPMMSVARACERSLALLLVLTVASIGLPARGAPTPAAVRGKVLRSATGASLSGAVVRVALRPDARIFESGKADE